MPTLLYRAAIHDLRGTEILPLDLLREQHPDLYEREAGKYSYRPQTIDNPVHPLGCRWRDVVFLSPVHPAPIFDALRESGRIGPAALDYWTLDADLLDPERTCILLKRHDPLFRPQPATDYLPYSATTVATLSTPSDKALERLRNLSATEPLFPWADIPHILHRGSLAVGLFRDADGRPVSV
ncbi:hypothetical protein E1218_00085 [Kribbella turkmenica]|uniref:Uncharacterized protein n=1 Tax=Kribbella turkmenica TaxID=2530375 RepID=A0A4R4XI95_9ACTN|nr:hypothetical protein [Kribbella turkmenica]TDD30751.1 hypothetical protein E1218_00085 [Kribbella turkmenica]